MPKYWEILQIARITIDALRDIGIENCCFVGGMACKLYTDDKGRQPGDLDILCITPFEGGDEAIKQRLCEEDETGRFYTIPARNRRDKFNKLFYDTNSRDPEFKRIKIDILTPGTLDFPEIHRDFIITIDKLPCAPLHLLLFHKVKAWDDRLPTGKPYMIAKIPADERDIRDLLRVASQLGLRIRKPRDYLDEDFVEESLWRIQKFIEELPETSDLWESLDY